MIKTDCERASAEKLKITVGGAGTEGVATVNGVQLRYITRGNGPHPLLCIPAVLGTPELHFPHQLEHFGREGSGFTVVSFDPRGYGTSRQLTRSEDQESFLTDAEDGYEIMKWLSLHPFSVIGWCNGGVAGILLASTHPAAVRKLALCGSHSYITAAELEAYEDARDISVWTGTCSPTMDFYGSQDLLEIWTHWLDTAKKLYTKNKGDLCTTALPRVSCQTLVVHGAGDGMCPLSQGEYLRDHVTGSRLVVMEQGGHMLHIKHHEQFNQLVEEFLTGTT